MNESSSVVHTFGSVEKSEWKRIHQRRRFPEKEPVEDPPPRPGNLTGLGLSGGGIRAAIFNLGLLQAMEKYNYLRQVDYLSTVSGGGYTGSALTWFCSRLNTALPFVWKKPAEGEQATCEDKKRVREVLDWLRVHGSYLTPGNGLNLYSLLAAILAGSLVTLSVLVPVFMLSIHLLQQDFGNSTGFQWALCIGEAGVAAFGLLVFLYAISTAVSTLRRITMQRRFREWMGRLLVYAVVLLIVGSLPLSHDVIHNNWKQWVSGISLSGIVAMASALIGGTKGAEVKGMRSLLLSVGLVVLVYGVFLGLYHLVDEMDNPGRVLYPALAGSVVLALFANINHVSMHRYYRNRLMEAFMKAADDASGDAVTPDRCRLGDIPQTGYPYHIVNTNLQTVGSEVPRLQQRGAESFILSPGWCGSEATGYVPTCDYVGNTLNLATAMAISGAAADTNTYATRSRPLNFIMALLNLRLGYWIRNPRYPAKYLKSLSRPRWYIYLFREILGRGLSEKYAHIHLSDGGHFENLGLYELVRRRCDYIIISDAGADPEFHFGDLAHAMELVRTDFGANIDIDIEKIRPDSSSHSTQAFVTGKIVYDNGDTGILLYIKTAFVHGLPADIRSYKDDHPLFPDEPTSDQFFDETQFEAYRELGYRIGKSLFGANDATLDKLIVSLGKKQPQAVPEQEMT